MPYDLAAPAQRSGGAWGRRGGRAEVPGRNVAVAAGANLAAATNLKTRASSSSDSRDFNFNFNFITHLIAPLARFADAPAGSLLFLPIKSGAAQNSLRATRWTSSKWLSAGPAVRLE